jgi:hypothetical protein
MDWIEIGPGFWNLRGSFTFAMGLVDIGTHCSLIKLSSGKFLLIDTIAFSDKALRELNELTSNGTLIEAVIATHPFHTVYFPPFFQKYPNLTYIGTPRHIKRGNGVNWTGNVLDEDVQRRWETYGVHMRIPDGAEFENPDENNHFSSVLVFHAPSRTIHVDDTIMFFKQPGCVLRLLGKADGTMEFWDLKKGLRPTEQAPAEFQAWVEKLLHDWDFDNICTAHTGNKVGGAKQQLRDALRDSASLLSACAKRHSGGK